MGHEIAHAIARHGAERMSQAQLAQLGGQALAIGLGGGASSAAILAAYGLGAQVGVLLPYGRTQESEADHIGLLLMAQAGYDPRVAIGFWQRMEQRSGAKRWSRRSFSRRIPVTARACSSSAPGCLKRRGFTRRRRRHRTRASR